MCGITGVISRDKPIMDDLIRSIVRQENRGRDSTGIITSPAKENSFNMLFRSVGPASIVLDGFKTNGNDRIGIGHNRYATAGRDIYREIQPMFTQPGIAMAHNGQIVNYVSLKKKLQNRSFAFFSESDLEVLLYSFAKHFIETKPYKNNSLEEFVHGKVFTALKKTLDNNEEFGVVGGFSGVCLLAGFGLLGFKDPNGIRPLYLAKKDDKCIFASETIAFGDYKNSYELSSGEAVFIDFDLNVYSEKLFNKSDKTCIFEPVYFSNAHSRFNNKLNEDLRYELGIALGEEFFEYKDKVDVVMDVPRTPIPAAIGLAKVWNLPYGGVQAYGSIRIFQEEKYGREKKAGEKFSINEDRVRGKSVAIIDDSIVRGTNSKVIVDKLFSLGARDVHFFSYYPPVIGICPFGIDISCEKELLMNNKNIEEAREYIGATTLNYLPLEKLLEVFNISCSNACLGCTKKEYPIDITEYKEFQELRKDQTKKYLI